MYIRTNIHGYRLIKYLYKKKYIYIYICTHTHTHPHTHTHIYIYTYTYIYQARVQEFVRGGAQNLKLFFFFFFFLLFNFSGGGPAQKIAEKMKFSTKKVAKHR